MTADEMDAALLITRALIVLMALAVIAGALTVWRIW